MRLDDLPGDACEHCHGEIPAGRRIVAIFCSDECRSRSGSKAVRDALIEAKTGRTCGRCGGEIAATKRADALYCSRSCAVAATRPLRARASLNSAVFHLNTKEYS